MEDCANQITFTVAKANGICLKELPAGEIEQGCSSCLVFHTPSLLPALLPQPTLQSGLPSHLVFTVEGKHESTVKLKESLPTSPQKRKGTERAWRCIAYLASSCLELIPNAWTLPSSYTALQRERKRGKPTV